MADRMREALIREALQIVLGCKHPGKGLVHHSDSGVHYAVDNYRSMLKPAGIIISMSCKRNCLDNSVMERFWGSLKSERTGEKTYLTRESAKADVIDYIEMFYNCKRLHSSPACVSYVLQFENNFLIKQFICFYLTKIVVFYDSNKNSFYY